MIGAENSKRSIGLPGTLSVNIAEEAEIAEDMYEPYLDSKGFYSVT